MSILQKVPGITTLVKQANVLIEAADTIKPRREEWVRRRFLIDLSTLTIKIAQLSHRAHLANLIFDVDGEYYVPYKPAPDSNLSETFYRDLTNAVRFADDVAEFLRDEYDRCFSQWVIIAKEAMLMSTDFLARAELKLDMYSKGEKETEPWHAYTFIQPDPGETQELPPQPGAAPPGDNNSGDDPDTFEVNSNDIP